jgi:hypothetical protein
MCRDISGCGHPSLQSARPRIVPWVNDKQIPVKSLEVSNIDQRLSSQQGRLTWFRSRLYRPTGLGYGLPELSNLMMLARIKPSRLPSRATSLLIWQPRRSKL